MSAVMTFDNCPRSTSRWGWLAILTLRPVPFWMESPWRRVGRWLALAVYLLAVFFLSLVLLENKLLFPGSWWRATWAEPEPAWGVQEVALSTADGRQLFWWSEPPNWTPADGAILYAHGNGNNVSSCGNQLVAWRKATGRAVMLIDYPGYGKSEGKPSEEGCYRAAEAAWEWMTRQRRVPSREILFVGFSLGGAVVIDLATRRDCRALIVLSSFTSFADMAQARVPFFPVRPFINVSMRSEEKIAHCGVPVFISHGTADDAIPVSQGERLFVAAAFPKLFHRRDGEGHWDPLGPSFFRQVNRFLRDHPVPRR